MEVPVILSATRTAIGKFGKGLINVPPKTLGATVCKEAVTRSGLNPSAVDEVIFGNVISAGLGMNLARQVALDSNLPVEVPAFTVNKVCGSGMKAVSLAAQAIRAGDAKVILAGGVESMSHAPYIDRSLRWGFRFGDTKVQDAILADGLWDIFSGFHVGLTGEIIAEKYKITREEADEFALESHLKASQAIRTNEFAEEIVPVKINLNGQEASFQEDECVRHNTTREQLAALRPVFKPGGVLTAGNSSQLSDGAAALVVTSEARAQEMGVKPMAQITGAGSSGTKPELAMEAPIPCCQKVLKTAGLSIHEVDLVEHNEAYSTASIAVSQGLGIDPKRFNIRGGAVALGHPIGCSGARILVTLVHAMRDKRAETGLATLCLGGGNAISMLISRCS